MAITSEVQKKYGNTGRNTGAKTYTLFRGEALDAKPTFAQPGDVFEEYGTGKVYVASRDKKNRTVWTEDASAKRQTESGQTGLPNVTNDDNGDVLTVVGGEWSKAAARSGGDDYAPLIVTLTVDNNEDLVGNKTYGEIHSAFKSGRSVIMVYEDSESDNAQAVLAALIGQELGVDTVHVQYIDGSTVVSSDGAPTDTFKYVYS